VSEIHYSDVERQLVEALPEIRPSAQFYWDTEGIPGRDCGPYIFFEQLFACYVELLLVLPSCARRDELLRRAFDVVDEMFGSVDRDVRDLAVEVKHVVHHAALVSRDQGVSYARLAWGRWRL
jgi:hypothetical protein